MKYIDKNASPDFFEEWKKTINPSKWNELRSPEKDQLRRTLLEEQGYICCYCNQGIADHPLYTKIEHLYPKDEDKYPEQMFDYGNLLLACSGGEKDAKPRTLHCDSKKGNNEPPSVVPLQTDCEKHFQYFSNGEMEGISEDGKTTIDELGLNIKKLKILREKAINEYFEIYEIDDLKENEIQESILDLNQKVEGKYIPFCKAIKFILNQYYT